MIFTSEMCEPGFIRIEKYREIKRTGRKGYEASGQRQHAGKTMETNGVDNGRNKRDSDASNVEVERKVMELEVTISKHMFKVVSFASPCIVVIRIVGVRYLRISIE